MWTADTFCGIVELDEFYFGAKRIRGKSGRGASSKTIVFGILKHDDKVYTEIVPNASKAMLKIQVHPVEGRHSRAYYKISTTNQGIVKVVDSKAYVPTSGEKAKIIYK